MEVRPSVYDEEHRFASSKFKTAFAIPTSPLQSASSVGRPLTENTGGVPAIDIARTLRNYGHTHPLFGSTSVGQET